MVSDIEGQANLFGPIDLRLLGSDGNKYVPLETH